MDTKICSICKEEKLLTDFYKDKRGKGGLTSRCKKCSADYHKTYDKQYRKTNRERINKDRLEYYYENREHYIKRNKELREKNKNEYLKNYEQYTLDKDKLKTCVSCKKTKRTSEFKFRKDVGRCINRCCLCAKKHSEEYRNKNRDKINALSNKWRKNNPEKIKTTSKKYRDNNKDKTHMNSTNWRKNNPEKVRAINNKHTKKKRQTKYGKLNHRMSVNIRRGLVEGKQGRKWELLVGYTVKDLKIHLEKLFTNGMNWDRFLQGEIHIDHKKPICKFNYTCVEDEEFKNCWSLENLQPLWAKDNLSKGAKYVEHTCQASVVV